jgi:hypothetical protein
VARGDHHHQVAGDRNRMQTNLQRAHELAPFYKY